MFNQKPVSLPQIGKPKALVAGVASKNQTDRVASSDSQNKPDARPGKKAAGKPERDADSKVCPSAAVIIFGKDDAGKAHASQFGKTDKQAAIKSAYLMGFMALSVRHDVVRNIAEDLPQGRVFESGKAFVPFVKTGVCIALEAHAKQFPKEVLELPADEIAELDAAAEEVRKEEVRAAQWAADEAKLTNTNRYPADWKTIKAGDHIVAMDVPEDGWWVAEVVEADRSTGTGPNVVPLLTLKWVDFEDEPEFTRWANQIAYFHPAYSDHWEPNAYAEAKAKG